MVLVYSIYRMVDKSVLKPIRNLTDNFANLEKEDFNITLPRHDTEEIDVLIRQVRKTAAALEERKNHRLRALEEEREKVNQIRSFALEQADLLGITDETDISHIITRLSDAVQEVEKTEMFAGVSKFVTLESKNLVLENDVSLIRPAALYLTDLLSAFKGSVKKGSVELALEESITNAIVHGNLEIPSELKEKSFDEFYKEVARRSKNPPYSARRIRVSYEYENRRVRFTISDDGPGFDWKSYVDDGREADQLLVHGRGITIMRTFASSIQYNKQGNEVTLTFEV
jgi:anti-sigma regulatory factor (Ser/Thr protein kinase)